MSKIIPIIVGGLVVAFLIAYFGASDPILFSERWCAPSIGINSPSFDLLLRNHAENTPYLSVCVNSNIAIFNNSNVDSKQYCFSESKITPKSSDLQHTFTATLLKSKIINEDNIKLDISIKCNQKIWSIANKACEGKSYVCNYKRSGEYFVLIK